jgi:uncharacterized membrane protein
MSKNSETTPPASHGLGRLSLRRLERMADIIFAVAILLLLVRMDFAPDDSETAGDAFAFLWKSMTQTLGFAISFLILAYYWMSHQEYFGHYTSTNRTHTFIELIYLLTIAGMPVNNDFIEAFPMELAPRLAISSDIFFAGMLAFLSWSYAAGGNRLVDAKDVNPELAKFMRHQALVMPACALVAAGAAVLHPFAWDVILFIGPLLAIFLLKKRSKK